MKEQQSFAKQLSRTTQLFSVCCIALGCAVSLSGCKSKPAKSGTHEQAKSNSSRVLVKGSTPWQIAQVVTEVFTENGFVAKRSRSDALVFEKPAGTLSDIAYGNWVGDTPVYRRVKVELVPQFDGAYELLSTGYNVRDKGGTTEEEMKLLKSGSYQKLLNEAAARLKSRTG